MVIIKYKKKDEGMFFSHLNVIRIWSRIMAISGIDVAEGPLVREHKMTFSGPTSVGVESDAEYVLLDTDRDWHDVENAIENSLPSWIELEYVKEISQKISLLCDAAEYKVSFEDYKSCKGRIREFLEQDKIEIEAMVHGKVQNLDVKERIFSYKLEDSSLFIKTGIGPNSAHIVELVKAMMNFVKARGDFEIKKERQFVRKDQDLVELDKIIKEKSRF